MRPANTFRNRFVFVVCLIHIYIYMYIYIYIYIYTHSYSYVGICSLCIKHISKLALLTCLELLETCLVVLMFIVTYCYLQEGIRSRTGRTEPNRLIPESAGTRTRKRTEPSRTEPRRVRKTQAEPRRTEKLNFPNRTVPKQ